MHFILFETFFGDTADEKDGAYQYIVFAFVFVFVFLFLFETLFGDKAEETDGGAATFWNQGFLWSTIGLLAKYRFYDLFYKISNANLERRNIRKTPNKTVHITSKEYSHFDQIFTHFKKKSKQSEILEGGT